MKTDGHVHMGYWPVDGELKYFSPRRVWGMLRRCGIEDFIVSSTSSQAEGIVIPDLIREAEEMKRVAGSHAHVFCWITGVILDADPDLSIFRCGVYEGIKLHGRETPWIRDRQDDLVRILDFAKKQRLNVQFHCGPERGCRPDELAVWAERYPEIKFDFAHCTPGSEISRVMKRLRNIYTDTAFSSQEDLRHVYDAVGRERVLFGSDSPVIQIYKKNGLTAGYREVFRDAGRNDCANMDAAFYEFFKT